MMKSTSFSPTKPLSFKIALSLLIAVTSKTAYAWSLTFLPIPLSLQATDSRDFVCVEKNKKKGQIVRHPTGAVSQILEVLPPNAYSCSNGEFPIAAKTEVIPMSRLYGNAGDLGNKLHEGQVGLTLELSDDWIPLEFVDGVRQQLTSLAYLSNKKLGVEMSASIFDRAKMPASDELIESSKKPFYQNKYFSNIEISDTKISEVDGIKTYFYTTKSTYGQPPTPFTFMRFFYVDSRYITQIQIHGDTKKIDPIKDELLTLLSSATLGSLQQRAQGDPNIDRKMPNQPTQAEEARRAELNQEKCEKLGFKKPSEKFWECVLTLGH